MGRLSRLFGMAAVSALLSAGPALSATKLANFDVQQEIRIPSQSLDSALLLYSRQTGLQIISSAPVLANKVAPALRGVKTPRQALERLLLGSDLSYVVSGDTVTIEIEVYSSASVREVKSVTGNVNQYGTSQTAIAIYAFALTSGVIPSVALNIYAVLNFPRIAVTGPAACWSWRRCRCGRCFHPTTTIYIPFPTRTRSRQRRRAAVIIVQI